MSHEKVLIVEDEENERSGLAEIVTSWGFRVETARDGAEGLDKATQWSPSIVITDLKMPRMGGIELLGHLAEQAQTIAVILVTAQGTIDSAVQAMRMGAYDYITKPIDTIGYGRFSPTRQHSWVHAQNSRLRGGACATAAHSAA